MRYYKIYYTNEAGWVCDVYIANTTMCCCSGQGETPQEALTNAMKFDN